MPKAKEGVCHICGKYSELSYEHVPPKAAFNDRQVLYNTIFSWPNGEEQKSAQNGMGYFSLCPQCNNDTGSWYGSAFVEWVRQGLILFEKTRGQLSIHFPFTINPLRVFKQIMTMVFSLNTPTFRHKHFYLTKFILNKESTLLPNNYFIYAYLNNSRSRRMSGITALWVSGEHITTLAEIGWWPFGYIVTTRPLSSDLLLRNRLANITSFSNYAYDEQVTLLLQLPTLPVYTPFPLDFRNAYEVTQDLLKNIASDHQTRSE